MQTFIIIGVGIILIVAGFFRFKKDNAKIPKNKKTYSLIFFILSALAIVFGILLQIDKGKFDLPKYKHSQSTYSENLNVHIDANKDASEKEIKVVDSNRSSVDFRLAQKVLLNLYSIGQKAYSDQEYDKAILSFNKALNLSKSPSIYMALGLSYSAKDDFREAVKTFHTAMDEYGKEGNKKGEANAIQQLASIYQRFNFDELSIEYANKALNIARVQNFKNIEATSLITVGIVQYNRHEYERAIEIFKQALHIMREYCYNCEGAILLDLGNAYRCIENSPKALYYYDRAIDIAKKDGNLKLEGYVLAALGNYSYNNKECHKSINFFEEAISIFATIGDRRSESKNRQQLGVTLQCQGRYDEAIAQYNQALSISHDINDILEEANSLYYLGCAYDLLKQHTEAKNNLKKALFIYEDFTRSKDIARVRKRLSEMEKSEGI